MDERYLQILAPGMYFDGDNLLEEDKIIPIKRDKARKLLKLLLKNRGKTITYEVMYKEIFSEELHSVDNPSKSFRDLKDAMPDEVKKLIKVTKGVGYSLPQLLTFLVPQYTVEKKNVPTEFVLCANNIPQDAVLSDMYAKAFLNGNVFAITGQPGMGKTELAKAFAYSCCVRTDIPERLRYQNIIWTTYKKAGLADTICNLPVEGTCDKDQRDRRIKTALRELKKPALLVIDNVDIESTLEDWDENSYDDLKRTGCDILFTSRKDLTRMFNIDGLKIPPLETQKLVKLFCNISGEKLEEEQKRKLGSLIEAHLQNNVYLVTLAAGLMESVTVDTLIAAFEITGELGNLDAVIYGHKDEKKRYLDTLTGHFARLYKMSDMTPGEKKLMMNLALLPVEGMNNEAFYQYAFAKQSRRQANVDSRRLQDKYWIIQRDRKVSLHPMVREVILSEMEENYNNDISMYLQNLADSMNHTHYFQHLHQKLQYGLEAFAVIKHREILSFEGAQIVAQIASAYDTLADKKNAYEYGMKAVEYLDAQDRIVLTHEDLFRLARCYNVAGYAVLRGKHTADEGPNKTEFQKKKIAASKKALTEAEMILKNLKNKSMPQEKIDLLLSKVSGNTAACFHEEGDYIRARDLHEEELRYRLEVNRMSGGKYRDMVASAYKNIATEYFYLSGTVDQKHNLEKSYENHCKAVKIYDELGAEYKLEWCIAVNRMVGTGLCIVETDLYSDKAVLDDYLKTMISAFSYLTSIDLVQDELKNSLKNIVKIFKLQEVDEANRDSAAKIIRLSETLPKETREELRELLTSIQKAI